MPFPGDGLPSGGALNELGVEGFLQALWICRPIMRA